LRPSRAERNFDRQGLGRAKVVFHSDEMHHYEQRAQCQFEIGIIQGLYREDSITARLEPKIKFARGGKL